MATFKGVQTPGGPQVRGGHRTTNVNSMVVNQTLGRAQPMQRSMADARIAAVPVFVQHAARVGRLYPHLLETIYGRIHITDINIDLGSVLSVQETEVSVWNAHLEPKQLTDITINPETEVELSGPQAPVVVGPLATLDYVIRVPADGEPTIDVFIGWTFGDERVSLNLTGSRIAFWSFAPTWEGGIRERLEWYTSILAGPLGTEQRRALRLSPRRFFELKLIAKPSERSYMELCCFDWGARRWAIPIWPDVQELTDSLLQGAAFIPCKTAGRDFSAGGLVAVRGVTAFDYEIAEVLAVLSEGVQLKRPLSESWPRGTRLYPVRTAQFLEQPTFTRLTSDAASVSAQFILAETTDWPEIAPTQMYRGKPVYLEEPEESQNITSSYQRLIELVDNRIDRPRMEDTAELGFIAQSYQWMLTNREQAARVRSLWYFLKGRTKSLWVPTFSYDLKPRGVILPTSLIIDIEYVGYTKFGKSQPGRSDIALYMRDGSILFRRIVASLEEEDFEQITLDTSLGYSREISASDILRISFIALCRMDQDFIEINHETDADGLSRAHTVWRSLRDDIGDV